MGIAMDEKTPMLETATKRTPPASERHPHRRWAQVGTALVVLATLLVVGLNTRSSNFETTPTPALANESELDAIQTATTSLFTPTVSYPADAHGRRDLLSHCEEKYITQYLNQFQSGGGGTYEQRYFICGRQFFNPVNGSIFFYNGNEGDVLLYLNNTGLMWENAEEFNALMVFAEHRYFGKSIPFADNVLSHMEYLSSTQALADFATLIEFLKRDLNVDVPVLGFGGSYGGMLATWLRLKYPHVVDGVIAGSAPVLHFVNDPDHPVDSEAFERITTFDMSPEAGASENCIPNMRRALKAVRNKGKTAKGRAQLAEVLRLCDAKSLSSEQDVEALVEASLGVYGSLAMGNVPYPSSYMTSGLVNLPAYPMRAACEPLAPSFEDDWALLAGFRDSFAVWYNSSGVETCFFPPPSQDGDTQSDLDDAGNFWGYLECAELYMPMGSDGVHDIFPAAPANQTQHAADCLASWGVTLRPDWAVTEYGGLKAIRASSNIVFSNGNYDPWSGTGVLQNVSESVVAVHVEGGAHHTDLFFSHPMDPPALTQAREIEKSYMHKWVREFYAQRSQRENRDA